MKERYLEVTFRKGKPLAAYLYLPRKAGTKSIRTQEVAPGLRVDYSAEGKAIGIEIVSPSRVTADHVNAVLERLGLEPLAPDKLSPIRAA
jgi:uncharacterized protein YuzE